MLEVVDLSKFYEIKMHWYLRKTRHMIFENVSFKLNLSENLLINGASGSGKSTLARILCGIESASGGEIYLNNLKLYKNELKNQISYVLQDQKLALNPFLSVKTQLFSVLKNYKIKKDLNLILKFFNEFGLKEKLLNQKPLFLSGGEAARIGLIRHLLAGPKILILDELTSFLDLLNSVKILDFLKKYQEKNEISYIFITHEKELLNEFDFKEIFL